MLESQGRSSSIDNLANYTDSSDIPSISSDKKLKPLLRKIFRFIRPSHTFKTRKNKDRIPQLIKSIKKSEVAINVGAGNTNYSPDIINLDLEATVNGDIIADGRSLPIRTSSVSLVISQAVLEHTPETQLNITELERVLVDGGVLYIEVPFMQPYHAHPHDYFRFTHSGLISYLDRFDIIEEGISVGPASATSLNLKTFLATLFSFGNKKLFIVFGLIFGWLTFPIKYFDLFLENNSLAFYGASGIYVIARKKD
jgi:SAM-dependent methyltransferase